MKLYIIFFACATLTDFVQHIKPALLENEFDNSILHMSMHDVLKLGSDNTAVVYILMGVGKTFFTLVVYCCCSTEGGVREQRKQRKWRNWREWTENNLVFESKN